MVRLYSNASFSSGFCVLYITQIMVFWGWNTVWYTFIHTFQKNCFLFCYRDWILLRTPNSHLLYSRVLISFAFITSDLSKPLQFFYIFDIFPSHLFTRCFGGLEVAWWPLVPKFAGSNPAETVGFLRVNKNPQHVGGAWMFVCCDCCVLSGRGLCDELITRSEESYRLRCVVVFDLENS